MEPKLLVVPRKTEEENQINTIAAYEESIGRIRTGDCTADQLRADMASFLTHEAAIKSELSQKTVKALQKLLFNPPKRKADIVDSIYRNSLTGYIAPASHNRGWQVMGEAYTDYIRDVAGTITDEDIQAYAARLAEKKAQFKKAILDPWTLDEFRTFLHYFGEDKLSEEQLARYDYLQADAEIERARQEAERRARIEGLNLDGVELTVEKGWHDRDERDIWEVHLSDRVDRETFKQLKAAAKRCGGYYSRYATAFAFNEEEDAYTFAGMGEADEISVIEHWERQEAEKQQRAATCLQALGDRKETAATESLAQERLTNTYRRARMALAAERAAHEEDRIASVLQSIGESLAAGRLRFLQHIRHGTHVELLDDILYEARDTAVAAENDGRYVDYQNRRPVHLDDVRYARWPGVYLDDDELLSLLAATKGKRGLKYANSAFKSLVGTDDETRRQRLATPTMMDTLVAMVEKLQDGDCLGLEEIRRQLADHKRLQMMHIRSLHHLRAALREFFTYRQERISQVDEVKLRLYALVGRKLPGFFPTPEGLADQVAAAAAIEPGMRVLEPQGGTGRLADAIRQAQPNCEIEVVEIQPELREILRLKGYKLMGRDFFAYEGSGYDRIVMNPPFENRADAAAIQHAYNLLRQNGRLVAICSEGLFGSSDSKAQAFRDWLDEVGGRSEKLPDKSFRVEGTDVATRMVVIDGDGCNE